MTLLFYPILVNRDCTQPLIRNHACPLLINPSMESTFPKNEEFKQVSGPSTVRSLYWTAAPRSLCGHNLYALPSICITKVTCLIRLHPIMWPKMLSKMVGLSVEGPLYFLLGGRISLLKDSSVEDIYCTFSLITLTNSLQLFHYFFPIKSGHDKS